MDCMGIFLATWEERPGLSWLQGHVRYSNEQCLDPYGFDRDPDPLPFRI